MADPQTPAPPAPPPDLLPDLQARVDLVARRLDLIERRVAAFENALNTLEKQAATDDAPTPETESVARFDDLEARVQRIERRMMRAAAASAIGAAATGGAALARPVVPTVEGDARALVFARWFPLKAAPGERVTLSATIDGFAPTEKVQFIITELGAEQPLPALEVPAGEEDEVQVQWTPPKPAAGGHREFGFVARCGGLEARSPILVVTG